ncbi:acetylornithine deacetylase [Nocardioides psychrotolerans]|uniref:Acetylornithine deacetylase n=1 Tax=Nocardioides psychrotolerans TaxID=1005945 RepID=A0A1I3EQV2_9ACTN|nr:acetylornithine deacetylase [Nocardioides psychrotolerans]SFI01322.1 acetylornithine deacetylase [Nocardioides psychrotolerans]
MLFLGSHSLATVSAVALTPTTRPQLSRAELRVLDAIDEHALVEDLVSMIQVPSVTGTDAESDLQHRHAGRLATLGFDVDTWKLDLDALAAHPDHPGTEAPRTEGYGVVGVLGPTGMPALILQGHVDVVPTGDLARWADQNPWSGQVRHGAVHGRGACDMKAGLAANLAVAGAMVDSGVALERPFALHAVISEEDGGLGAFATMLRGHRGDAAIITEPTSGKVVVANAGALTFQLRVEGRATHGSTRLSGHSALDAFWPVHAALVELERRRNTRPDPLYADNPLPYPISIGTVRAGDWASSVPDLLVAAGRLGVHLGEPPAVARRALERAVTEACDRDPWLREHPVEVTWPGGQFASGRIDTDHRLVAEVVSAIGAAEGRKAPLGAAPYGSDLRLYAGIGDIPTLHYGPGDVGLAHGPREHVDIDELLRTTRTLAVLAARRCDAHL